MYEDAMLSVHGTLIQKSLGNNLTYTVEQLE
jgi:hypothetical protein